jgi:peptide methionine sulfoxide reductase msrA/msrB
MGGQKNSPTYRQISSGTTGHAEAVRVTFDPRIVSYETLTKLFLEIHDPTQKDRQGPDIGDQYRSAIFTTNSNQEVTAQRLIALLKKRGYDVVTEVSNAGLYWPAEAYHQDYYVRTGKAPYCHSRVSRF